MSRTYRTHLEWKVRAHGRDWTWEEEREYLESIGWRHWTRLGWNGHYYLDRKARDRKTWDKPSGEFKRMNRRWERSKVRQAMREGKDVPTFRKSDQWEWT